jgi:hypothetical protein
MNCVNKPPQDMAKGCDFMNETMDIYFKIVQNFLGRVAVIFLRSTLHNIAALKDV